MSDSDREPGLEDVRREAAAWIARMRAPEAERSRLAFERWRAASPLHRQLYDEMQAISQASTRLGASALAREHFARPPRAWHAAPSRRVLVLASIATLICAGVAAMLLVGSGRDPQAGGAPAIASAVGRIERVRLADGTMVTLDTDSVLQPVFDAGRRLVRLVRGRARFDVAHDAARPFMVEAGDRVIFDRGTVFDVVVGRDGVKVALLRGTVEVRERAPAPQAVARLAPGQMFSARQGGAPGVSAAPGGAERWVDGVLSYERAPLDDVVADINRYSTRKIRLADPALAELRVTGVFRAVPVEASAKALAASLELRLAGAANGDLLLSR